MGGLEDDDQEKVIVCTMPEVNKDRHDTLMDGVGTLYDQCKAKLDANHAIYKARLTTKLVGSSEEDTKEAEDKLEEVYSKHDEIAQQYKEAKEKEIEEAYQRYLDEQTAKQNEEDEKAAARGVNAGRKFRIDQEEE